MIARLLVLLSDPAVLTAIGCGIVAVGFGLADVYFIAKGEYDHFDNDGRW